MSVMRRGILTLVLVGFAAAPLLFSKDYRLYYLGGQSNMDGYGYVKDLPPGYSDSLSQVMIFHGDMAPDGVPVDGAGVWSPLRPGHGTGFKSDGIRNVYSDRFGAELSFAKRLQERDPGTPIALLKYSRGGTSIDCRAGGDFGCWDPDFEAGSGLGKGVNQYDHFLATVRNALSIRDIDGDGDEDHLIPAGILWMQGESDASYTKEIAEGYERNLKRLMDLVRAALRQDDLPAAIGRISDSKRDADGLVWDFGSVVREAQAGFVEKDGHAALVTSTDGYGYSDTWHYDSAGYLDLGSRFAEALWSIDIRPTQ